MCSANIWIKSLFACREVLAVVLLFSAVGYFISHPCISSRSNQNNETTEHTTSNTTHKWDIISQKHVPSLSPGNHPTTDASYCHIRTCKIIRCSGIPKHLDPGEVTRIFIENTFKVTCDSNIAIKLIIEDSTFPDNKLQKMWLKTDVAIDELTIANCFLNDLSDDAFSLKIYNKMIRLYLSNNNISILRRASFGHLPKLQDLFIERNEIKQAEKNLLKDIANNLQRLQLEDAIANTEVLRNITGADVLSSIQILSLQHNYIPIIDSSLFYGVPNVVSLYLFNSHVKTVRPNAFEAIIGSVKQIMMSDNSITTLPDGLFSSIIQLNPNFGVTIDNNSWHCNCSLKWMQDMIRDYPNVVRKTLICSSPERNAGKSFTLANFCDETTLETSADIATRDDIMLTSMSNTFPTTESDAIETTFRISCEILNGQPLYMNYSRHQVFSSQAIYIEIPIRFQYFSVSKIENDFLITIPDPNDVSLILFANDARSNLTNLEKSIRCISKVNNSFSLRDLQTQTSYTICLLDNLGFSPLNCLGLTTSSFESESSLISAEIIVVFIASLLLICLVSALLMFIMVRRHPAMLRGNKRVLIVKRRTLNAMVLPKGLSTDTIESANRKAIPTISQNLNENEYITPLPPARNSTCKSSKSSASSAQSDSTSYISGIEPTLSQLNSWRLKRTLYMNHETEAPPLPPYPHHYAAQSLSVMANESGSEDLTCMM